MLSFVLCRLGAAFVIQATRWRSPAGVVLLLVEGLNLPLPLSLIWRKTMPLLCLQDFADVQLLPEVRA